MTITVAGVVHEVQLALIEGTRASESQLLAAGELFSRPDYEDVVVERTIAGLCGNPTCSNPVHYSGERCRRYRIALREHRVYDLKETYKYCSDACVISSRAFSSGLEPERLKEISDGKIERILAVFGLRETAYETGVDLGQNGELGFSKLRFFEKEVAGAEAMSMDNWKGHPSAIEGFIPQSERGGRVGSPKHDNTDSGSQLVETSKPLSSILLDTSKKMEDIIDKINPNRTVPVTLESSSERIILIGEDDIHNSVVIVQQRFAAPVQEEKNYGRTTMKPSLKTSQSSVRKRTVTWADNYNQEQAGLGKNVKEGLEISENIQETIVDDSLWLTSAEAIDGAFADEVGGQSDDDTFEFDQDYLHWPAKHLRSDMFFQIEDTLHDSPPDGFNLNLSSFGKMWMALFGWVTCWSIAHIYGQEKSSQEDFLLVNGTEYPRKIFLGDGKSSEIRRTLDLSIGRILPGIVMDLKISTPVSSLEVAVGQLLDTMSFVDALPAFRTEQWRVVVLLFLDALSVHKLPSLSHFMAEDLLQKLLSPAQVGVDEYQTMRDFLLPLGHSTHASPQGNSPFLLPLGHTTHASPQGNSPR